MTEYIQLLVLAAMQKKAKHGYAVLQDIVSFSGTEPGPGSLYGAIDRLTSKGLIALMPSDIRKQQYRITREGREFLKAETSVLHNVLEFIEQDWTDK